MTHSNTKKLLLLSYYWPPLGGPGAIRPVKFTKYLPDFGYDPIVITRKAIAYHSYDNSLINDVKDVRVIRTETIDPARLLWLSGMRDYRPRNWQRPIKQGFNFPDHKIFWLPFAYQAGVNHKHDYLMVTAPPFSAFIAGYIISLRSGKPLILDFRDAWVEFPFLPYQGVQKSFSSYLEKKISNHASLIIVVDENIRTILIKKYPTIANKIHVIQNGYDPGDFATPEVPQKFTLSYLGTVRSERNPENILRAINELVQSGKMNSREIHIKFIGHVENQYKKKISENPYALLVGHKPYRSALRNFSSAHAAILITTGSEFFFPSRQNEYLASGLPIIVIGRSKGIHLLTDAFAKGYPGWNFDYNDIEGIKEKILMLYQAWHNKKIFRGQTPYTELTRKKLTHKLALLLDKI